MSVSRLSPVLLLSCALAACGGGSDGNTGGGPDGNSGAVASDSSFVDDFVQDNIVNNRLVATGLRESYNSYDIASGQLRLSTTKSTDTPRQSATLATVPISNTVRARLSLSSQSSVNGDAQVLASVAGVFFNDIQDGGIDGSMGDVFGWAGIRQFASGDLTAEYCLVRSDNTDFTSFSGFFGDGNSTCETFEFDPVLDTFYDVSIALQDGTFTFEIDGVVQTYTPPVSVLEPSEHFKGVRAWVNSDSGSGTGTAIASFDNLSVDSFSEDFSTDVIPYYYLNSPDGSTVSVENGSLQLATTSDGMAGTVRNSVELMRNPGDYAEAELQYSSASTITGNPEDEAWARLVTSLYNDGSVQNPVNPGDGDVISYIDLHFRVNGSSLAQYCTGIWDTRDGVQDWQDTSCQAFSLSPEVDTRYKASILLDRDNNQIVYTLGDETATVTIDTAINPLSRYRTFLRNDLRDSAAGTSIVNVESIGLGAVR